MSVTRVTDNPKSVPEERWAALKGELHQRLLQGVDYTVLRGMDEEQLRLQMRQGADELCRNRSELLTATERATLVDELINETLGYGPLEPLLRDPSISDILINGPKCVFVERGGKLEHTPVMFRDEAHLVGLVQKIVARVGRRIDESSPTVDARLPDGSRLNAVIQPLALDGALVSIRRFRADQLTGDHLLAGGSLSEEMLCFLAACMQAKINVVISGGTGSGKTTLLNILSTFIPPHERLVTIEDAAELRLSQPHVARLETRPANLEGSGEVTTRDLIRNALRMRPDRILVGECRGGEAFDMLQAMNTGHEGSMTTIHANSAQDALSRLQLLVGMAGTELPIWQIDKHIAAAVQIIVQTARLDSGERKITQITEITGFADHQIQMQDLYLFDQTGVDERGRAVGKFTCTGVIPKVARKMRARGVRSVAQAPSSTTPHKLLAGDNRR